MKYKKIMFMLVLAIFIFGAASVCASDVNDTVIASEDTSQLELSAGSELDADNLKTSEKNTILTQTNNDESMSREIDSEVLGADIGTYSGLSEEIGSGGNIELIHDYYTYDSGSTIEISDDNSVIDGKGAVIDMAGSNKQAFDVSASGVIIKNLTIKNAKYNALGGAILFGRSGTVENCIFTNNSGTSSGGAVYFSNTGTVTNCTFVGNTASVDGGAVYFSNTGIVTNCNFINNKATGTAGEMGSSGDGGAVHFTGDGTVTNCNFTGNTATGDDGGAVHFTGDGTVSNCTFVGNTAGRSGGGAVYFSDTGIVTNCNFTNNKATGGSIYGGAIWIYSGTVTNCSFTNHSANYGGAVRMGSGSVENCNFTDNTATRDGGAIWIYSGTVTNCNFTNSSATGAGGAVYFYDNSEVTNCNFIYNVAKSSTLGGGAIFFMISGNVAKCNFTDNSASFGGAVLFGGKGNISNSNFTNNSASNGGGAINMASGSVENCNFTDNKATSSSGGSIWFTGNGDVINCIFTNNSATCDGGAVYFYEGATGRIINCNFTNNKVTGTNSWGGAIRMSSGTVSNCNFTNNTAIGDGGAVFFYDKGTVSNCNFTDNIASIGGAVYFDNSGTVSNCNFTDNTATRDGGAVYFSNTGSVSNCNFTDNTASGEGGAVYFSNTGSVTNCNFTNNKATGTGNYDGGGAVYFYQGTGSVTNCNFTNNSASSKGGAVYFYQGTGSVTNCNFTNNTATGNGGAINIGYGTVTNCNFTNNKATGDYARGGAIFFVNTGTVTNCNFTDNTATYSGGAIRFQGECNVTNCNFTNNSARNGGAVVFDGTGNVTNCNFTNNTATSNGGAVYFYTGNVTNCNFADNTAAFGGAVFFDTGNVTNCNFADNTASLGGAVFFFSTGNVTNCNFTGNNATTGSAIYFYSTSATKTVSNSRFLNNRANAEALEITKNDNNITITFTGGNNLLNAIYSSNDAEVTFTNVTYWGANGITTVSATMSGSNKEEGQNITVGVVVNNELVLSDVMVTDENGMIVLDISAGENYYISARHNTDSYYTEAEKTISNNTKFNVNVTSQTTTNKTVNITAKSNIPNDVVQGKLLFILPNGTQIEATYGDNGIWWAEHTFDAYGEYKINATYVGLDNVTINNGTITINKVNSTITLENIVLDYGETKNVTVTTTGATGITAKIDGNDVTVINNYTIQIPVLDAGTYNLTVTTIPDDDHNPVTKEVNITVNKVNSTLTVNDIVFDYGSSGSTVVSLTGADGVNATVVGQPKTVVKVNGTNITVSDLDAGTYTLTVTTIADKNHNNITKNATITVNKVNATLTVNDVVLDYGESKNITVTAEGTTGITAKIDGVDVAVNNYTILISELKAGNHTLSVTTISDDNHNPVNVTSKITVNKVESTLTVGDIVFDYGGEGSGDVSFTGASEVIANVVNQPSAVISISGNKISVSGLAAGTYTLNVTTVPDENHTAVTETATITVNKVNSTLTLDDVELDYGDSKNVTVTTEGATGITAKIDGVDVTVNGYTIPISGLGAGNYTLTVKTIADENHNPVTKEVNITVNKLSTEIILANETLDLKVGDEVPVLVNLTPAGAGNLTFTSSNEDLVFVEDNVTIVANSQGQAIITVSFAGNENYTAAENKTITVNVELNDASVSVENDALNLKVDETCAINATIEPDTIMLHIKYTSSNESVATVDKNGIVTAVGEGRAIITIEVGDDEIYAKNSTTVTVTVSKINTTADVSIPENITVGDNSTVNVILPADAKGNVTVKVDGEVVDTVPVKDGNADVTIPSMSAGNHTVEIAYSGDGKYNPINETKEISVSKNDITPEITIPSDIEFGDNATVDIKLPDDATGNVTLTVDGKEINTVPVTNGTASVKLPALDAGNHTAEIAYSGDDKYKSASKTTTISIDKDSTKITAADVTATYKVDKYLVITLKDSKGNPLANATVTVDLNTIKNYTADENGQIKIKVSNLLPKSYSAKITFAGNNNYLGSDATAKVVVKKATPKITASNKMFKTTTKNKKYTITLKDNTGKPIRNAKVYLKVNGKTYKATTNSKGKATFKITKLSKTGTFKATVTYKGNKYYNKASKKVTVKVISIWKTISKGSKAKSTVKEIQRALKNNGYYLTAYGHYLKVDGIYWDYTVKAVKQFQKAKGLKVTGKVDEKTAKKLGLI